MREGTPASRWRTPEALLIATQMVILGLIFGITIASGVLGFVLLFAPTALRPVAWCRWPAR